MRHDSNELRAKFPSFYRQDILEWRRDYLGWTQRETARQANISIETVKKVFKGKATATKVYPVAHALGLDWIALHNLNLKESDFHLACTGNGGTAG